MNILSQIEQKIWAWKSGENRENSFENTYDDLQQVNLYIVREIQR